jgi:hypothetical protein
MHGAATSIYMALLAEGTTPERLLGLAEFLHSLTGSVVVLLGFSAAR